MNIADQETQFRMTFLKLGFNNEKSKVAKFDKDRINQRFEQISLPECGSIPLQSITLDEIRQRSKRVVAVVFKGVDLTVDSFEYELKQPIGPKVQEIAGRIATLSNGYSNGLITLEKVTDQILGLYKKASRKVSILEIPVEPEKGKHSMSGCIIKGPLMVGGDIDKMLEKTPVFMENILLGDKYDGLSVGTYVHEVTHGLLDRHKGVVENYYNNEMLSIFMEKVAVDFIDNSSDKMLLKCYEVFRLADVKRKLSELATCKEGSVDYLENMGYIQSSLYAGVLFDRYSKSNTQEKAKILAQVRSVLNGKIKLSNFIRNQQLSLEGEEVFDYIDKVEGYATELKQRRKTVEDFEVSKMSSPEARMKAVTKGDKITGALLPEENSQSIEG